MNKEKLLYYKDKLIKEKMRVNEIIGQLKDNGMTQYNAETSSELSFYDNHPSDIATEVFEAEMGISLEANEAAIIGKVNDALKAIDDESYGKCKQCGKDIDEGRLEALPYAEHCIECQNAASRQNMFKSAQGVGEERLLRRPIEYGFGHYKKDKTEFDAEDTIQAVGRFNDMRNLDEYDFLDDDSEDEGESLDIEKISNQQYKNQLPD